MPGQIEEQVSQAVEDHPILPALHRLQDVGMMPENDPGAGFDELAAEDHFTQGG